MNEVQEGVNSTELAAQQNGVVEQVAATNNGVVDQNAATQSVDASTADGQQQASQVATDDSQVTTENQAVPYVRFKAINDAKNEAEAKLKDYEAYIQGLKTAQANTGQQQQTVQQTQQSLTLQVMKEMGYDKDSILTGEEQARVTDAVLGRMQAATTAQTQLQTFMSNATDYIEVVGQQNNITGQFMFAEPMLQLMKEKPTVAACLQGLDQTRAAILCYELASAFKKGKETQQAVDQQQQTIADTEQVIQQANSQQSISSVAGQTGTIDKGAQIRSMTDEQFKAYKQEIMNSG
jgi:hypothetical protein